MFRIQLVFVWWNAFMCKFSLFTTAIHHRHPEPGMVDIHSGMVRMCAAGQMSATACEVPCKECGPDVCPWKWAALHSGQLSVKYLRLIFTVAVESTYFYLLLSMGCISFNKVLCELFLRSVTQQLLYSLLHNSWLYRGRFMLLRTALPSYGTEPV